MTRPKVPDDKRIRTAQACESCKRRKQKCNGLQPCNTCTKRSFVCEYVSQNGHAPDHQNGGQSTITVASSSPTDRRRSTSDTAASGEEPAVKRLRGSGPDVSFQEHHHISHQIPDVNEPSRLLGLPTPIPPPTVPGLQPSGESELEVRSRQSTTSGADEVAEVYTETRMLQDPTGRLLYLGDSATLSYLQYIRMIVESVNGPSQFTTDPSRHRFMEATSTNPPDTRAPVLLPDRKTADVLVKSYFTNSDEQRCVTAGVIFVDLVSLALEPGSRREAQDANGEQTNGLVEVFERNIFSQKLNVCYQDPLAAEPTFLCLLNLVFAIGLVLATYVPGTEEDQIIQKLQIGQADRAELFFRSAKCLGDPTTGFEDADFWSVQALLLMSMYMLAKTKRNAAYAYHGMAVRSAFALGLHRQETVVIFPVPDRVQRRNVWRSLYVLDRFLAAALGRPTSISEEDCSPDALVTPDKYLADNNTDSSSLGGLNAAVRSCQVIGIILKKIYAQRKTSTKLAQDISEQCKGGPQKYNPSLHWRQAMNKKISPSHGMAVLHVNLLYCHAVILLTRPFFLFLMNRLQQQKRGAPRAHIRPGPRMEKFSEACVNAAYHTVALVHTAYEGKYLPQRDPFIIHFLFAAALVVLSSEFASLHNNVAYAETFQKAMSIMDYCAKSDPQANRLVYILTTFNHVIVRRDPGTAAALRDLHSSTLHDIPSVPNTPTGAMSNSSNDPMANFFLSHPTNTAVPTSNPASATFNPTSAQPQQPQGPQLPSVSRRGSTSMTGPAPSPGVMPSAPTPTTPNTGDFVADAEWFHFDALWENWAVPGVGTGPATASSVAAVTDPALFNDTPLNTFDVSGSAADGAAFATPPVPSEQMDARFSGVASGVPQGAMQVPLYPMMRFTD